MKNNAEVEICEIRNGGSVSVDLEAGEIVYVMMEVIAEEDNFSLHAFPLSISWKKKHYMQSFMFMSASYRVKIISIMCT